MGCLFAYVRWWILLIGLGLTVVGCEETRIAWRCTPEPETVELESLENGYRPKTDYLTLGPHLALMEDGVYQERVPKGQTPTPSDVVNRKATVNHVFYPVVSLQNPVARSADPAQATYSVLVKSGQFHTVGELFDRVGDGTPLRSDHLTGVVINEIDPIPKDERQLLIEGFPNVNLDNVLIVELDRKPRSRVGALLMLLAGLVIMIAPLALWLVNKLKESQPAPVVGPLPSIAPAGMAPQPSYRPPPSYGPPPGYAPQSGPPSGAATAIGHAPPSDYALQSGPSERWSQPPAGASVPPISARLQPGARVRVSRKNGDVFGTVVRVQAGQVSVDLDEGRTVWVAGDAISLA